jgi:hypothetical protein
MRTASATQTGRTLRPAAAASVIAVIGLAVMLLGPLPASGLASGLSASGLVQPPGTTFAAAFPGTPHRIVVPPNSTLFPGSQSVTEYFLTTRGAAIRALRQHVQATPSYLVLTAVFRSPEAAEANVTKTGRSPGMAPVMVGDVAGYQGDARVASGHKGGKTQRKAFEALLSVSQGNDVYVAIAFNRNLITAKVFAESLELTPAAAVVPGSAGSTAELSPTHAANQNYRDGETGGAILLVVFVLAVGFNHRERFRPPRIPNKAAMREASRRGGAYEPPVDTTPSAQFAWMYEAAQASAGPVAAPPPTSYPPPDPATRHQDSSGEV